MKGFGPIMSNFFGCFFQFFMGQKKKIENIVASALKSCIEKKVKKIFFFLGRIFFSEKPFFCRAKNATVTTWRSGTDFCWLFCVTLILKSTQYFLTAFNLKSSYPFLSFHQRHLARSLYGLSSKRCGLATTNSYLTTNEGFCKRFKAMAWPSLIWKGPRGPQ